MRNIIYGFSLFGLIIISCNKIKEDKVGIETNTEIKKQFTIAFNYKGDPLIGDLDFVKSIDSTCRIDGSYYEQTKEESKADKERCVLNKIKFNYESLQKLKTRILVDSLNGGIKLYIQKSTPTIKERKNADIYEQAKLYVERNNVITDSLVIYHEINSMEGMVAMVKYHYFDRSTIYLLDLAESEEGTEVSKWQKYKVNENGKIVLTDELRVNYNYFLDGLNEVEYTSDFRDKKWYGDYSITMDPEEKGESNPTDVSYIELLIKKDSVILKLSGTYLASSDYLLKAKVVDNNRVKLIFDRKVIKEDEYISGYDGTDMGELLLEGDRYYLRSPWVNKQYYNKKATNKIFLVRDN